MPRRCVHQALAAGPSAFVSHPPGIMGTVTALAAPADEFSPAQQHVWSGLMAAGEARPEFDPMLPARRVDVPEERLAPAAERLGVGELVVAKSMLAQVHQCERLFLAEQRD